MSSRRVLRLNSLLKEVISEVVTREVKNPLVSTLVTITKVEVTNDLHHAKVFFSVIGTDEEKKQTLDALVSAKGFIGVHAAKKVVLRYFPTLTFKLDEGVDAQMRIDTILKEINNKKND